MFKAGDFFDERDENEMTTNNIPIVFAVNDNYVKYVSVAISSIIYHRGETEEYWIYIFHSDITEIHQEQLNRLTNDNVHVECMSVKGKINRELLYIDGRITEETYYRILIPSLLPQWDKVIYLDSDLVCLSNIAPMLSTDIGENHIAGVVTIGNENRAEYTWKHLGIPSDNYINAGVLIFNNAVLRKQPFLDNCYKLLKEKKYLKWHDQDLLNTLCFGKIYFLEPKWNTTVLRIMKEKGYDSEKQIRKEDLNCCILHYASVKPWKSEMKEVMLPFWESAYHALFTRDIVCAYEEISDTREYFKNMCASGKISLALLMNCVAVSLKARIKKV